MTTRTKYLQIFAFWGNVYQFRLVLSNTLVEVGNCTHRKLGFWKQNFHAILCDLKVLNDTHILRNCVYQKIYFVESIFWSVQYYWQSSFSNWMNLLTIREFTQRLSVLTNHSSRHSFYLYHLWPFKNKHKNCTFAQKSQLISKMHHRCVNNPKKRFLLQFKMVNTVCRVPETKMGDFKLKAIDWLFVVVVQIGFPVVFQPTIQRFFVTQTAY